MTRFRLWQWIIIPANRQGIDEGLVLLVERAGTLKAEDIKRLDIIAL